MPYVYNPDHKNVKGPTAQKMKFSIKKTADLVTLTEETLNGKLHFIGIVVQHHNGL